ncbi:two-component sensor histidine kinase [Cellulosimicrobium terreum]|nr:two-component sensor histidine kinase [Cellulosimicrobium terreum]
MHGPHPGDWALAALLTLAVVLEGVLATPGPPVLETVCSALAAATLVRRRVQPVLPLSATAAALVVPSVVGEPSLSTIVPALVAVYSAVVWGARTAGFVVAGFELVLFVGVALVRSAADAVTVLAVGIGLFGIAVASGVAVASRRAVVEAARDRADRAEATRELEARRRVADERVRIARELHDVIGHRLAVISVQAGLAERFLTSRPESAREALERVQSSSEDVLAELGTLVRVFRDGSDAPPTEPVRSERDLPALVDEARAAGLDVTVTVSGSRHDLPPMVGLAVYRVVQESLTNARKHGDGRAVVSVERGDEEVRVTTTNAVAPTADRPAGASGPRGFGLVGLRERAIALGGTLTYGVERGAFVLRAQIPVPAGAGPVASKAPLAEEDV